MSQQDQRSTPVVDVQVRDVALLLPDGATATLALLTLDDGTGPARPTTLAPAGLERLRRALLVQQGRAARGQIAAVAVTGKPGCLAAGADLAVLATVRTAAEARAVARLGQATFRLLEEMPVPTFAYVSGTALGGGLELALACTYRTVAAGTTTLGVPETYLGLVPGWGGCYRLPRLVGVPAALELIVERPLAGNRMTDAAEAAGMGLVDAVLGPDGFLEQSLAWTVDVLAGRRRVQRPPLADGVAWDAAVQGARRRLDRRLHGARPAPYRALDLVGAARTSDRETASTAEEDALTELILSPELRASLYAADLTRRGARTPAGAPPVHLARPVRGVGIVGAGLMATQLAVVVAQRLDVPVRLREVDEGRAAAGRAAIRSGVDRSLTRGGMTGEQAARVLDLVSVGTDLATLAGADLVVEAVTESMPVKQRVLAELEDVVAAEAVLATNTSALSVTGMAEGLRHPGRVIGLHFFNPVAQLPLVEVVRTPVCDSAALATGFAVAGALGKTAVGVADRPGFVVNRLLLRLLAEVLSTVERGTPVTVADAALRPLGLPMGPFALLQLVGLPVALHVLRTLHRELGDRYPLSPGLERLAAQGRRVVPGPDGHGSEREVDPAIESAFGERDGSGAPDAAGVLETVLAALTQEVGLLLEEAVVPGPSEVDLCLLTGAGWPLHLGGITPYLDRSGHAERLLGRRFHPPGVADVPVAT